MGGRGLGGLLVLAALSGCSLYFSDAQDDALPDAGAPDALDYQATLDIDIVVYRWRDGEFITVYLAEVDRPCNCAYGGFAHAAGTCTSSGDVGGCWCDPLPAACLQEIRVDRGDAHAVLDTHYFDPSIREGQIPGTGDTAVMHLRGCGAETDLTLPIGPYPPAPVLDPLHGDASTFHVSWSNGPPPIEAMVSCGGGFSALSCHEIDGQVDFDSRCFDLAARALAGDAIETAHGQIRLWQASDSYYSALNYPVEEEPGRWTLGGYQPVTVRTAAGLEVAEADGATFDPASQPLEASIQFTAPGQTGRLSYTAGPIEDTIGWTEGDRICTATVPHVVPAVPLELGDPYEPQTFTLSVPITTLTCNMSGPKSVGFDLSWDLGIIVRPDL